MTIKILFCILFALLISCTKKEHTPAKPPQPQEQAQIQEPSEATAIPTTTVPPVKNCDDGQPAKLISVKCKGTWKIKTEGDNTSCVFSWGPKVQCPDNTKPVSYEAVCYGDTVKTVSEDQNPSTPEDCAKMFGEFPASPNYELQCCEI